MKHKQTPREFQDWMDEIHGPSPRRVFIPTKPICKECSKPINDLYGYRIPGGFIHSSCK